jgi:hypothetical protein
MDSRMIRKHICSPAFELCEFLFLRIWSHAILFVRPPMTRIRCGHALPETPPPASRVVAVTDRRGRPTDHRARGWTSHGRARSPECAPSILGLATQSEGGKLFLPANPWEQTKPNWNPSCSDPFGGRRCNSGDRRSSRRARAGVQGNAVAVALAAALPSISPG